MQLIERSPNSHMLLGAVALTLLRARGDQLTGVEIAKTLPPEFNRVEMFMRSAVDAATTSDPGMPGYQQVAAGFIESLRSIEALAAMAPFARRVPLRMRLATVTASLTGSEAIEGRAKAISELTLTDGGLAAKKAIALCVVSDELLRFGFSIALDFLNAELRSACAAATNRIFLGDISAGISPIASASDPLADLRTALAIIATHGAGRYFWIVDPLRATQLATYPGAGNEPAFPAMSPNGGEIQGVRVLVTTEVPQDSNGPQSIVVDAAQLVLGDEGVTLRATRQGDIVMDSAPTVPDAVVSMFQTNSVALLAERHFGAQRARNSAVALISGADYSVPS